MQRMGVPQSSGFSWGPEKSYFELLTFTFPRKFSLSLSDIVLQFCFHRLRFSFSASNAMDVILNRGNDEF